MSARPSKPCHVEQSETSLAISGRIGHRSSHEQRNSEGFFADAQNDSLDEARPRGVADDKDYGIVLAGHGSRDAEGVREFGAMVDIVKQRAGGRLVTHGFLEFARPTIDEAARENIASGSRAIVIVPGILLAATHAKNDMPNEVQLLRREFPQHEFHFASAMNLHPAMLEICRERIIEAETKSPQIISRAETCLIVVGRGTSDPDANSEVAKLARMLEEGMSFGASFVCYSGTAKPLVADGLRAASRLGFRRFIILSFFLFTGVLIKRIHAAVDEMQARSDGAAEWLKCGYLGVHERVADLFLERAAEAIAGRAAMNCSLCKYRVQIIGYERELGAAQTGHHFHARAHGENEPRITQMTPMEKQIGSSAHSVLSEPSVSSVVKKNQETDSATLAKNSHGCQTHPIEQQSFEIIESLRDWSQFPPLPRAVFQRLVHTTGDVQVVDEIFISQNALESGVRALANRARIITDVTMVQSGLRRSLLDQLGIETWCGVHDAETHLLAKNANLTRSAAGIRRTWQLFGNNIILAIGDAPTAVEEAMRLIREQQWRPHLIIGLPVGFVGTREAKEKLRRCLSIARVTNSGTRGGSPWAATVVNALLIHAVNQNNCYVEQSEARRLGDRGQAPVISGHGAPMNPDIARDSSLRSE